MKLVLSFAAALLVLVPAVALACERCEQAGAAPPSAGAQAEVKGTKVTIPVEGMSCGACAARLTNVLKQVEGVKSVTVSLEKKSAELIFDEANAKPERAVEKINDLGYRAGKPVIG